MSTARNWRKRNPDGTQKTIHGYGVVILGKYRGWTIERHWGGHQARRLIDAGAEIETVTYPFSKQVKKAIDAWEEHAKEKYGIENREPRSGAMVGSRGNGQRS